MVLSTEEQAWIEKLSSTDYDQGHLLKGKGPDELKSLVAQIQNFDTSYPGGALSYIKRARKLLEDNRNNVNVLEGYKPAVPQGEFLETGSEAFTRFEQIGLTQLGKTAFVIVAGGLGERLGYPGIKLGLPIETTTGMTYLEYYIRVLQASEQYASQREGKAVKLPLAIMTSGDTHQKTVELLEANKNFGLTGDQLTLMQQQKVPTLIDNNAHLGLDSKGQLETKPHGHGDVHTLLCQHGLPEKWLSSGLEWMFIMQDTNGLSPQALVPMLGVSKELNFTLNSLGVPRKPGEAVGAICRLEKDNGDSLTINVEYNLLAPLLASAGMGGDVADPKTGFSAFPGNTNVLLFNLPRYSNILKGTGGAIPEFVNPKYKDSTRSDFKSSTRLECLMQEIPRLFTKEDKVGMTQLDRWLCFSTVKNNLTDAIAKSKSGTPPESPFTGESDRYYTNAKLLEIAAKAKGCDVCIAEPAPATFLDIQYRMGPRIVMYPSFAICLEQVKERINTGSIKISQNSTLILEGGVQLAGLQLDGTLILRAPHSKLSLSNLKVTNDGWNIKALQGNEENEALPIRIRGFTFLKKDQTEIIST